MDWMKKAVGFLGLSGLAIALYMFFKPKEDEELVEKGAADNGLLSDDFCVAINRGKFKVKWLFKEDGKDKVPSGLNGELSDTYFKGRAGAAGAIGGFFKGIDTFPSRNAAKYYKKEMVAWVNSDKAFPWWNMTVGELICNK